MKRSVLLGGLILLVFLMGCTSTQQQTPVNTTVTETTPAETTPGGPGFEECNYSKIEVYFYYSPMCPHCKRVEPYIDDLRDNYTNVTFYYCNVQNLSEGCYKYLYYVVGVPTVVVHAGNITASLVGERDVMKLDELIKRLSCCGN